MRLTGVSSRAWNEKKVPKGITLETIYFGPDPDGLGAFQVATATAKSAPSVTALRELHAGRKGKTQVQLVVAVEHGESVTIIGPDDNSIPMVLNKDQAERQLQSVLTEPDSILAVERLATLRQANEQSGFTGFANNGLFATHHLKHNVPQRPDWEELSASARPLLSLRAHELIKGLGFETQQGPNQTLLLTGGQHSPTALAVLLDDSEQFEVPASRFNNSSAVALGLAIASDKDLPWLVVLRKDQIRLYPGKDGVGVGSKGQSETYFEIDLANLDMDYAGLLPLVFSAEALADDGLASEVLEQSARYATELGSRLRERIYDDIVPPLAVAVAKQLNKQAKLELDSEGLATAYRVTLRILFRLLFQAYAEDRRLLPADRNEFYAANSIKENGKRLLEMDGDEFGESSAYWNDLTQVWNVIDVGDPQWQVPAYNGGLFSTDAERSPEGALIKKIELPNTVLGPVLRSLLIDKNEDGELGLVDFSSLSVREFGTIYEGLLESSLSLATQDLMVDSSGAWVPAKNDTHVDVAEGDVYFHTASGERKATGSYFTPKIVVDHLIERSIVPVLETHLAKIEGYLVKGDAAAAVREFFDFRVADLAMGSGHFLVAAVDKIEALMRTFLTRHNVPGVTDELLRLEASAIYALGADELAKREVDKVGLLRRQIARRCIYGLDINPMAVELARLALWIHTFVPGLPMSNLDHGLVCANSLTGIGTVDEALDALVPDRVKGTKSIDGELAVETTFFDDIIIDNLASAKTLLLDLANASEANKAEVQESAKLLEEARLAADLSRRVFDAAVAARLGKVEPGFIMSQEDLVKFVSQPAVAEAVESLSPAHMPYLFPEVFLRDNSGFDVLLGNPPWEELMVEEPKFWLRVRPGLLGLKPAAMKAEVAQLRQRYPELVEQLQDEVSRVADARKVLIAGPYPGLGTGDIDLYQAFAWRFWQLLRNAGRVSLVLPRSAFSGAGGYLWRREIFENGDVEIHTLVNKRQWVFPITAQYSIALICIQKDHPSTKSIGIAGPFGDAQEFLRGRNESFLLSVDEVITASKYAVLPQLPTFQSAQIISEMHRAVPLEELRPDSGFLPIAEFHATNDRNVFDANDRDPDYLPVRGGSGFDIWNPETEKVYAWAVPEVVEGALQSKRERQVRLKSSPMYGMSQEWVQDKATLPLWNPRIAFRDVARSTDGRTMIAALVPGGTALTNKAPYLFRKGCDERDEAYVLGVLSSIPLDWYVRRYVEIGVAVHLVRRLPIPEVLTTSEQLASRVTEIAGRLAAVDDRYAAWAAEVGVPVGSVKTEADKNDLICELDALVSLLYGLSEDQVVHIFETFREGWDYQPRLDAVLDHYRVWKDKA